MARDYLLRSHKSTGQELSRRSPLFTSASTCCCVRWWFSLYWLALRTCCSMPKRTASQPSHLQWKHRPEQSRPAAPTRRTSLNEPHSQMLSPVCSPSKQVRTSSGLWGFSEHSSSARLCHPEETVVQTKTEGGTRSTGNTG